MQRKRRWWREVIMLCMLCMFCCDMLLSDRRSHDTKRNYGRSTQQRSYLMVSASPTTSSSVDVSDTEDGTDVGMLAEEEREGQRLAELHPFDTALLISLANGFLVALDEDSGDVLWSFNTGAPLVSSNVNAQDVPVADTSHDSDTDTSDLEDTKDVIDDDNVRNGDTKRSNGKNSKAVGFPNEGIFPGTDGSLYTYQGDPDSASPRIHRLPVGIRELVDASPSPALDGTMLLGSQESVVFVLDAENGQVLRRIRGDEVGGTASAFMSDPESLLDAAEEYEKGNLSEGGDVNGAKSKKRKVFLTIGRKDYVVRAIHPAFGEQWNVSYAFLQRLSSLDVKRSNSGNLHIEVDNGYSRFDPDSSLPMYMFKLGADNSLRRYDASGKRELWVSKFDAPPLVAYPPAGNPIDLLATAVFQDENKVQVQDSRNIKRNNPRSSTSNDNLDGGKSSSNALIAKNEDTLVIGVLGGGLYGMRVSPNADSNGDTCMSEDDGQHATADLAEEAEKYSVQNPVASDRTSSTKNQNSAASTALIVQNKGPSESNFLHKLSEPNMDHSCAESFGLFSVEKDFCDSHMLFLPDNLAQKPKSIKKSDSLHWEDYITMFKDRLLLFLISRSFSDFISREAFILYLVAIVAASIFIVILKFLAYLFRKVTQLIIGVFGYSSSKQKTQSRFMMKGNSNLSSHERHAKWTKEPDGSFRVGRLKVEPAILGYGSGGTVVFEGVLDGRKVAVKRLLRQFVDLAKKEIETLIASDEHPNVVRCFAMEEDSEFVYLALERCVCTLADVVSLRQSEGRMDSSGDIDVQKNKDNPTPESSTKEKLLDPVKLRAKISDNWHLISKDGSPTLWALQVAENVAEGLAALHARGIVHRDVKPHNVLITESGRAKLSDMGLSKRLVPEQASFETAGGAGGSPGWQAPEQLVVRGGGQRRLTASVDVFSFGLLLHYCLSGGKHPFGEGYERDAAIMHGKLNLNALSQEKQPEALDLIEMTLAAKPQDRPPIAAVLRHPMWWSTDRRLSFLIDVSDTVEGEDRVEDSILLSALEKLSHLAIGEVPGGNWANVLDPQLLENLGKYRRYDFTSLKDLLRVIRNKHSHYRELPIYLQEKLGTVPEGFYFYFSERFPNLLSTCFYFGLQWCREKPRLVRYFSPEAVGLLSSDVPEELADSGCSVRSLSDARKPFSVSVRLGSNSINSSNKGPWMSPSTMKYGSPKIVEPYNVQSNTPRTKADVSQRWSPVSGSGANVVGPGKAPKVPPGFETPNSFLSLGPDSIAPPIAIVPDSSGGLMALFPRRPSAPVCDFYARSGHCAYGETCRFDHPPEYAVKLNAKGLPLRPDEEICVYWKRNGECKFGPSCKFNHPL